MKGPPKPIVMSHATSAAIDGDRDLPVIPGRRTLCITMWDFREGDKYYSCFPPFHVSNMPLNERYLLTDIYTARGFMSMVIIPLLAEYASPVLGPPHLPPSGSLISQIMEHQKVRAIFAPPVILEQLMLEPKGIEQIRQLDFLLYAGGPLTPSTGHAISKVTSLCSSYGTTETGTVTGLFPSQDDWGYLEWHPDYGVDMQLAVDGAYELVSHRNPDEERGRPVFDVFPDAQE